MWFVYVSFGSNVSPRMVGCFTVGRSVLLMCSDKLVLYSAGSGVKSVVAVLLAFSVSWLWVVQSCICCRYCWTCCCAVCCLWCVESIVMSSA